MGEAKRRRAAQARASADVEAARRAIVAGSDRPRCSAIHSVVAKALEGAVAADYCMVAAASLALATGGLRGAERDLMTAAIFSLASAITENVEAVAARAADIMDRKERAAAAGAVAP